MARAALSALIGLSFLSAAPAFAQKAEPRAAVENVSPEHRELARRFASVGGAEEVFMRGAIAGFVTTLERRGVRLDADQRAALEPGLRRAFARSSDVFLDELTNHFATTSTSADLERGVAYYESEAGQHYAAAAIDLVFAMVLNAISPGASPIPTLPDAAAIPATDMAMARRMGAAFNGRLSEVDHQRMAAAGIDGAVFVDSISRYFAGRLSSADLEAAVVWAETAESQRLEASTPQRAAAEELAMLRAVQAIDAEEVNEALRAALSRSPA